MPLQHPPAPPTLHNILADPGHHLAAIELLLEGAGRDIMNIYKRICREQQDALLNRDLDGYCRWLSEDVEFADSGLPRALHGRAAVRDALGVMLAPVEAAEFEVREFHAYPPRYVLPPHHGSLRDSLPQLLHLPQLFGTPRVAMTFQLKVTYTGMGPETLKGVDVFEFRGTAISRLTSYYDPPAP